MSATTPAPIDDAMPVTNNRTGVSGGNPTIDAIADPRTHNREPIIIPPNTPARVYLPSTNFGILTPPQFF